MSNTTRPCDFLCSFGGSRREREVDKLISEVIDG